MFLRQSLMFYYLLNVYTYPNIYNTKHEYVLYVLFCIIQHTCCTTVLLYYISCFTLLLYSVAATFRLYDRK